jgi:hypothetical protein
MKPTVVLSFFLLLAISGCHHPDKVIEVVDERPKDVFNIKLCETLSSSVMTMLSPSNNNREKYPALFSDATQERIVLTKESDVYVSYVLESASVPSTLGFYTYTGADPAGSSAVTKGIVFPHVSAAVLSPGDSRRIGKFPAGTVIGFYLIIGGYNNNTVNYSKPTFWTNHQWNTGGERQHIMFREQKCDNIVMAFEDKSLSSGDSDKDYNDLVFIISDNSDNKASTAFDLNAVPSM